MEIEEDHTKSLPPVLNVAVAVNGNKNSNYAMKWCLDKFFPEGVKSYRVLHVRPNITSIPTPMGNYIPISNVREDVAAAYKKEIDWKTKNLLLPYKRICAQRKVYAEAVVIESDKVAEAIAEEVAKFKITRLVIGATRTKFFSRKGKGYKMSSKISEAVPGFCTVYVVSKGKLSSVRLSKADEVGNIVNPRNPSVASRSPISSYSGTPLHEGVSTNTNRIHFLSKNMSFFSDEEPFSSNSSVTEASMVSKTSFPENFQRNKHEWSLHDEASTSSPLSYSSALEKKIDVDFEVEILNIELKHIQEICQKAKDESEEASHQVEELSEHLVDEAAKLQEIKEREDKARELLIKERESREAAEKEAEFLKECARRETEQRQLTEVKTANEIKETKRLEEALRSKDELYTKFSWEEIEAATRSFSEVQKIGIGANGTVYKGSFHGTVAAVKVLHSVDIHTTNQFKQELEVLGRIHHRHLLLLLGACPERGCLVYEFMENGSLDDRLCCKDGKPPLSWRSRFRIAWEVASALLFLHSSKPQPIIHRDLKPANILLDGNLVSKIGDVGLSTSPFPASLDYGFSGKATALVGTMCYIDPEYQRSGLVSPKSDIYALGIVILQLLTAKPAMGVAYLVETAARSGTLGGVLDFRAGMWPANEALEMAMLGLRCSEMKRKDRPDLKEEIMPALVRLKNLAEEAEELKASRAPSPVPQHFICPILKKVMEDPYVCADGYTYDRRAIEVWLRTNDRSPVTNVKMANKKLIPNLSLRSAIEDWSSSRVHNI